jgi:hypothetical protein
MVHRKRDKKNSSSFDLSTTALPARVVYRRNLGKYTFPYKILVVGSGFTISFARLFLHSYQVLNTLKKFSPKHIN